MINSRLDPIEKEEYDPRGFLSQYKNSKRINQIEE